MGDFLFFIKMFSVASVMMSSMFFNEKTVFLTHAMGPWFKIESTLERTPIYDDVAIYRKQIEANFNVTFSDNEKFHINDIVIVRMCDTMPDNNPIINDKNGYTSYQVENSILSAGFSVNLYPKLGETMRKPILYVTVIRDEKLFAQSSTEVLFNAKQKQYNIIVKRVK